MRKLILLLISGMFLYVSAYAQRTFRYPIGQVSDNRFHAICEDISGFIWIGTENGLNRYDGYNFYKFFHDDNDSLSLMSNYVRSLYTDKNGTLWIGTNRGLQYLRPSERSFYTIPFPGSRNAYIRKISQFSDGRIWIAAQGSGIYWVDPDNPNKLNSVVSVNTNPAAGNVFRTVIEDKEGTIWVGTSSGILLYDPKTDNVTEFRRDIIDSDITGINCDDNGIVYITTNSHLFVWNPARRRLDRVTPQEGIWEITHSFLDNEGIKISLRGKGLLALTEDRSLERVELNPTDRSLEKLDVSAYYRDKSGNRWIGCFQADLILSTKNRDEFDYWKFADYQQEVSGTVTAMATDTQGRLWVGYNNNGLTCFSSDGRVLRDGRNSPYVNCLFRDSRNRIWAGYPSGGLALLNVSNGQLRTVVANEHSSVSSIAEDIQGRIYYSELGNGFSRLDPVSMKTELYSEFAKTGRNGQWLTNDWIHIMYIDKWNRLWIGHDNGADCFDIVNNTFLDNNRLQAVMGTSGCTCITEEKEGVLLFGTTKGLIILNTASGETHLLNTASGLSNDDIRGIVKDNEGFIWVSTPGGVNRINPDDFEVSRFHTEEIQMKTAHGILSSTLRVSLRDPLQGSKRAMCCLTVLGNR